MNEFMRRHSSMFSSFFDDDFGSMFGHKSSNRKK